MPRRMSPARSYYSFLFFLKSQLQGSIDMRPASLHKGCKGSKYWWPLSYCVPMLRILKEPLNWICFQFLRTSPWIMINLTMVWGELAQNLSFIHYSLHCRIFTYSLFTEMSSPWNIISIWGPYWWCSWKKDYFLNEFDNCLMCFHSLSWRR